MINPIIFKSYDIRGIYPAELDEKTALLVGKAFINKTGARTVAVGRDARLSSPALFSAIARGIMAEGAKVYDIGRVPTECLYFVVGHNNFPAGIMITASHNPKEYNGFKMVVNKKNDIEVLRGKDLLEAVTALDSTTASQPAEIERIEFWHDYINHIFSFIDLTQVTPLKIAVDASNGVAGEAILRIKDKLPAEIISLNFEPDGNFPNHSPNPLEQGSVDKISQTIEKERADFGLIFDGDADRIFLVDERGKLVGADITLLILAKHFLKKNPGSTIAYNAICSKAVPEFIKKWGGLPLRTRVGFVNVREGLMKNSGIMGGELSGHYCFKDNYYLDSGMISFLTLLQAISQDNRSLSELAKELSPYAKGSEINFEVENKDAILENIKQKYSDGKQDFLDGVTVEYKDWWFNVRPSNTEPLLRLTIEADTQKILEEKQAELEKLISPAVDN
jgi:phosphomannomutase